MIPVLTDKLKLRWVYLISGLFILANILLIVNEFYYFTLLPIALVIGLLALLSLDKIVFLIVFCTPLSINLTDIGLGVGISIPTDPLMAGVMLLFIIKLLLEGRFDRKITKHPVTVAIIIYLAWLGLATVASEMPIVSLKFFISKLWFIITFYFVATQMFRKKKNIGWYLFFYILAFTGIITYTIIRHASWGFMEQPAHWVMEPFYADHTSYGAILAMFFPLLVGYAIKGNYTRSFKIILWLLVAVYTLALILSYTRAAWVSLVGALGVMLVMVLRIKFRTVLIGATALIGLFLAFQTQIYIKLEKNRQDSSADLGEHVQSITNISSDASNLERLNRWSSAWRMFKERPFLGWGPGTYMFQYAPFQLSSERTIISTNMGDMGNAHSEYIGPLAEAGLFGSISFILIVFTIIYTAVMLFFKLEDKQLKLTVLLLLLGLITYFIHGMLNNFLDTDKASAPFWGFVAAIVAIDVHHSAKKDKKEDKGLEEATAE